MRVFITGIAGFLGSHLAEHLLAKGHHVTGVDNFVGGSWDNLAPFGMDNHELVVKGECQDTELMHQCCKDVDVVYHCAATAHEGLSVFSPAFICDNVFQASVSVFSAAAAAGVKRVVFLSSMARYGNGSEFLCRVDGRVGICISEPPFDEKSAPAPVDPYGIAKVAAEQVLKVLAETHGFEYQIAVPHNIIGTRQCYIDPYRNVASIFLNRLKQGKPGIIYGDGEQRRCFSPVWDILPCLEKLGLGDLPNGEVWNLGPDNEQISIKVLYELCRQACGIEPIVAEYLPDRPREVKNAWCTADKARRYLGFENSHSLAECIMHMQHAIPEGGKPFEYDRYPLEICNEKTPATWTERLI